MPENKVMLKFVYRNLDFVEEVKAEAPNLEEAKKGILFLNEQIKERREIKK